MIIQRVKTLIDAAKQEALFATDDEARMEKIEMMLREASIEIARARYAVRQSAFQRAKGERKCRRIESEPSYSR